MKKKILTIVLAMTMLAAQTAAFAENNTAEVTSEITADAAVEENTSVQDYVSYIKSEITVNSIEKSDNSLTVIGSDNSNGPLNAMIFASTLIFDNTGKELSAADLKDGMKLSVYTNAKAPMTLQFPVTYRPAVVIVETENNGFVDVDTYNEEGVNSANTLKINDADKTGDLVVFYENSSRSIPALTTPTKVVSIEAADGDKENTENNGAEIDNADTETAVDYTGIKAVVINGEERIGEEDLNVVVFNGNVMLPVRVICEKLGYKVAWDSELSAVTVGETPMGINFVTGVNAYNKARMMPQQLSNAPIIVAVDELNGLTYVPVEFFSDILGATLCLDHETLLIYNQNQ